MLKTTQLFGWEQEPVAERFAGRTPLNADASASTSTSTSKSEAALVAQRSPSNERQMTLSMLVAGWVDSLTPESRPHGLCTQFPRIANRLALCWADPDLSKRLLDDLFTDKRGTRRGFPPEVLKELTRLRQLVAQNSYRKMR